MSRWEYATSNIAKQIQAAGLMKYVPDRKWRQSVKIIHKFADDILEEATARHRGKQDEETGDRKRYIFMDELLQRTQDPYVLRSELLNILVAGRDTTAGLLANTWHFLARRPDIWAKLRAEVDPLEGEKPDYTQIKDMKYLRWVLNESLRLMPIVPGNMRTAVRDTILPVGGGPDGRSPVFVPQGHGVEYSVWSMHRREDFFGDEALDFKPELWEHLRPGGVSVSIPIKFSKGLETDVS